MECVNCRNSNGAHSTSGVSTVPVVLAGSPLYCFPPSGSTRRWSSRSARDSAGSEQRAQAGHVVAGGQMSSRLLVGGTGGPHSLLFSPVESTGGGVPRDGSGSENESVEINI